MRTWQVRPTNFATRTIASPCSAPRTASRRRAASWSCEATGWSRWPRNATSRSSVYPRFEQTVREFSAFLSSRGIQHVVVDRKSKAVEDFLAQPRELLTGLGHEEVRNHDYMCTILHPDLIEGLNCTLNPALICLNTIDGYGILQQIHGRILRKLKHVTKRGSPAKLTDASRRMPKRISQLRRASRRPSTA